MKADALFDRALAHHRQGRLDEAAAGYAELLRLKPEDARAYNNLGVLLRSQSKFGAAAACYIRSLGISPNDAGTHSNLGNALRALGRLKEAEACHRKALKLDPNYAEAYYNLGIALKDQGRIDQALDCFDETIRRKPEHVEAHWDRALAYLVAGDFARGWAEYEWRWKLAENAPRDFEPPAWDGSPLEGRRILLHAEQGMGDSIQFVRYVPLVAQRGGRVLLECQAPLAPLLATVDGVDRVIERKDKLPDFDVHAPLLSLPRMFQTTAETIPSVIPYLAPPGRLPGKVAETFEHARGRLKVGLVWAGKPSHRNDRNRSAGLEPFLGLLGLTGIAFFGLQVGPRAADLEEAGCDGLVYDLAGAVKDFTDSAAIVQALDLVISVDTAPVHLAGALGRPVWALIPYVPDWRWLLGRDDSPWYPSLRLFRQQRPGDWDGVFKRVAKALITLAGKRASGTARR